MWGKETQFGRDGGAEQVAAAVAEADAPFPLMAHSAEGGRALIAVRRHDTAVCATNYETLLPRGGTIVYHNLIPWDRLLGLLAQTCGRKDIAIGHYEEALTFCKHAGHRTQAAWTAADYAELLLDRNQPGSHDEAITLQDTALTIAREPELREGAVLPRKLTGGFWA